ncbi:hypothetical protein BH11PSE12_BH11PSE12_00270 [soil metagenome]
MTSLVSQSISDLRAKIPDWLKQSDLHAVMRVDQTSLWQEAWENQAFQSTHYAASMIDYQHVYLASNDQIFVDISMVLLNDGKPCAIWPLSLIYRKNCKLTTYGSPVLPPFFVSNLSSRTIKKIIANGLKFIQILQNALSIECLQISESSPPDTLANGLTEWHQQWLSLGASISVKHNLYVDLSLSLEEIKSKFRKSYRSLINVGQKLWSAHVMDSQCANEECWNEFKSLHRHVAGRVTRDDESWALQYQMIKNDEALLICLRDLSNENRLIGAGFFQMTRDSAQYAVAAYDRDLFDQPIGHIVQMRAIEQMKKRGIRWYEIGERMFPCDEPKPSEKELAISLFKQGFATHLLPKFFFDFRFVFKNEKANTLNPISL